jgi:hypothetical protein
MDTSSKPAHRAPHACNVVVNMANEWFRSLPRHQPFLSTEQTTAWDRAISTGNKFLKLAFVPRLLFHRNLLAMGPISNDSHSFERLF